MNDPKTSSGGQVGDLDDKFYFTKKYKYMLIAGLKKFSLLDFPGKISAVIFTSGCNFRCGFCHNKELVLPELLKDTNKQLISEKSFFNFLEKRKGLLDGISICGGEPCLQKDLIEFCKKIKNMGFLVKLDTNGSDSKILEKLLQKKLLDYIAMDIKNPIEKLDNIIGIKVNKEEIQKSIKILLKGDIDYEFRTTIIKGIHSFSDIEKIVNNISGAKNYYIQNYQSGNTLESNFIGEKFFSKELKQFKKISEKYIENVGIRD